MTDTATSTAAAPTPPPRTHLERACQIAFTATPFRADTTQLCAGFDTPGHATRAVAIRSREFVEWLRDAYTRQHDETPSSYTLREARNAFEGRAWFSHDPARNVARRVLGYGRKTFDELEPDRIVLDLARPDGRVVDIDAHGWRPTPGDQHTFYKHPAAMPLPLPKRAGDPAAALDTLRRLLGVPSDLHWRRVLIWLVNAIRPTGPYPVLAFHGPANSGKTRAIRLLRHLIDPTGAPLTDPTRSSRQIEAAAWTSHVLALDTCKRISPRLAFTLWGISYSTGHTLTEPHSGRDPVGVNLYRPILLSFHRDKPVTLRDPLIRDEELASRTLTVALESNFPTASPDPLHEFDQIRPAILALLCDAATRALSHECPADLDTAPRLGREALWAAPAAPVFHLTTPDIQSALHPDTEPAALTHFLSEFLGNLSGTPSLPEPEDPGRTRWNGTLTDLRHHLPPHLDPGSPEKLAHALRRATHHLKRQNITAEFHRSHGLRTVTLGRPGASLTTFPIADPPHKPLKPAPPNRRVGRQARHDGSPAVSRAYPPPHPPAPAPPP